MLFYFNSQRSDKGLKKVQQRSDSMSEKRVCKEISSRFTAFVKNQETSPVKLTFLLSENKTVRDLKHSIHTELLSRFPSTLDQADTIVSLIVCGKLAEDDCILKDLHLREENETAAIYDPRGSNTSLSRRFQRVSEIDYC